MDIVWHFITYLIFFEISCLMFLLKLYTFFISENIFNRFVVNLTSHSKCPLLFNFPKFYINVLYNTILGKYFQEYCLRQYLWTLLNVKQFPEICNNANITRFCIFYNASWPLNYISQMNTKENYLKKRFLTLNLETQILNFVKVSFENYFLPKFIKKNV